ncbi:MAG: two pore domain potassium channel family protein [Eubacterium sp.]|nr:two pore domain potassium channel family protein [Eubacterium sp.]
MKKFTPLRQILRQTHTDKIVLVYIVFVLLSALGIWVFEPNIPTFADALWYCYAVISTAGFGDIVVTSFLPKIISVVVTLYSGIVIALITGVVVNYYTELINRRRQDTLEAFMDKLERLPELSKEELTEMSEQVKRFRR